MQCTLLGQSEERKLDFWYVKTHLFYPEDATNRFLLNTLAYLRNYTAVLLENTNPGWLTALILCTCEFHSLRSEGVCVNVCVCVRLYCSLRQYLMRRAKRTFNNEQVLLHIGVNDRPHILHCILLLWQLYRTYDSCHMTYIAHEMTICCNPTNTEFYRGQKKLDRQT